jgi:hypothetical protein
MQTDELYDRARRRAERRLAGPPRLATLHAALFTLFTVPAGLFSVIMRGGNSIDGVIYWVVFFWSLVLALHAGMIFLRSGAWGPLREQVIEEEVKEIGTDHALDRESMMDLHVAVSDDIRRESGTFMRILFNAAGNVALWPGVLVALMGLQYLFGVNVGLFFTTALLLALFGTLALGFILPLHLLRDLSSGGQRRDRRHIYARYETPKVKRDPSAESAQRLELAEDGELVWRDFDDEETARKRG